jgi:hypothetical protein
MSRRPKYDEYDPWATYYNAPVVRRHPKRQRKPATSVIGTDDTQARDANVVAKERIEQMRLARHG